MSHRSPVSAYDPSHSSGGRVASQPAEQQLMALGIDDPLWLPTLLAHLARGGVIMIERSGDMLIMPAALEHPSD